MAEKDIAEKLLEDYEDVFADIFNAIIFHGKRFISEDALENAQPVSMYKMEGDLHEQERDSSKYWKRTNLRIAMLGLENESRYDGRMPLRIVGYDGAGYRAQYDNAGDAYPVITLVLNFGDRPWRSNKRISDLVVYPEGTEEYLKPYFNDWKIHVVDVAFLEDEEIARFQSDFRAVADYLKKKRLDSDYCGNDQELNHVDAVMKLLAAITGDPEYVESLSFRKEGESKTMDMHLRNMMDRNRSPVQRMAWSPRTGPLSPA